jgi:hypothetical protein
VRAGRIARGGGALRSLTKDSADRMARSTSSARTSGALRPVALAGAALGTVRSLTKGAGHGGVTRALSPVEHSSVLRSGAAAGAALVAVSAASAATTAIRRRAEAQ